MTPGAKTGSCKARENPKQRQRRFAAEKEEEAFLEMQEPDVLNKNSSSSTSLFSTKTCELTVLCLVKEAASRKEEEKKAPSLRPNKERSE